MTDASLACKVLVLTGSLKAGTVSRALAAGADGYVVKSEDAAELLTAVFVDVYNRGRN